MDLDDEELKATRELNGASRRMNIKNLIKYLHKRIKDVDEVYETY